MSRLRTNPQQHKCQNEIGAFDVGNPNPGKPTVCGEPAVIRCNTCKQYFCDECWTDHLEMTVVVGKKENK